MSRKITSKPNNKNCKHHHKILPVFLKATDSSLSLNKMKISTLCTKGTASQLFPHKRKYQYYAPREQLLSSFPTRENINIMHQGNSFSAFSQQEKISILCTKGTASQLFPHKRRYQYYAPREQLLSSFPSRENVNIIHQGNSFSAFSQQKQGILITTQHFIDHVGVTN